ncbi:hypothetical protein MC378_13950 [Polaribacter sp. MSW13]|uniref:Lipoprotein n=1 Tax=Polaribacter marinus TaxID=2916838 RepID=A0A9X2AKP6_9FLAO|nr:hypothetical protein [Polaribacter marinus]MCI2230277.1 hypothetical protein [Polaribacter marinus]
MKKSLILLFLFIGIISCQENKPKGVWLKIKNKALTKKNGFTYYSMNSIMDFNKFERTNLLLTKDSIKYFEVNFKEKTISKKGGINNFGFKLYGKDSLEIYYEEDNLTEVFIPIYLNKKILLNKRQIVESLINREFYSANGDLKLNFSESFSNENSFEYGIKNERILKTQYLNNNESTGFWYIGEKDRNFFLILNFNFFEESVYHIETFDKDEIKLKGINTKGISDKITNLKTSL